MLAASAQQGGEALAGMAAAQLRQQARLVQGAKLNVVRLHNVQVVQPQPPQALVHAGCHPLRTKVKVLLLQAVPPDLRCSPVYQALWTLHAQECWFQTQRSHSYR